MPILAGIYLDDKEASLYETLWPSFRVLVQPPIYDTLTYFWGVRLSLVSMLKYPSIASRPPDEVPFWEPGYQLSQLGLIFSSGYFFAEDPSGALSSYRFHIPGVWVQPISGSHLGYLGPDWTSGSHSAHYGTLINLFSN